jgi:PKD repeat protein
MRWTLSFIVLFLFALVPACKRDDSTGGNVGPAPQISSVNPNIVNPGTTGVEGRIHGSNFGGLMSVNLGNGVAVEQFQRLNDSEIYIFFSVNRDAQPGPKTVVVATATGATSSDSVFSVGDNRLPEAKFTVVPFRGIKGTPFRFNASNSDDDGSIVSYKWNFGDGKTATGRQVSHSYNRDGAFSATLTVTDNKNATASSFRFIEVDASKSPIASFTVSPTSGDINTTFTFDGSASKDPDGKITNFFWNFGDGGSARGEQVQHNFARTGGFGVALVVTDNSGESGVFSRRVDIGGGGPGPGPGPGPNPGPGTVCTQPAGNQGFIFGSVVGVNGNSAIVQFPQGTNCSNSFYLCGDMRKANTSGRDEFFGIIKSMSDLGNGQMAVENDCPLNWPPQIGTQVFLYYKSCSVNSCP